MANPADPGTFENWITARIAFGNTRGTVLVGSYDSWITARIYYNTYPDGAEVPPPPPPPTPTPELVCAAPEIEPAFDILADEDEFLIIYHSSRLLM